MVHNNQDINLSKYISIILDLSIASRCDELRNNRKKKMKNENHLFRLSVLFVWFNFQNKTEWILSELHRIQNEFVLLSVFQHTHKKKKRSKSNRIESGIDFQCLPHVLALLLLFTIKMIPWMCFRTILNRIEIRARARIHMEHLKRNMKHTIIKYNGPDIYEQWHRDVSWRVSQSLAHKRAKLSFICNSLAYKMANGWVLILKQSHERAYTSKHNIYIRLVVVSKKIASGMTKAW